MCLNRALLRSHGSLQMPDLLLYLLELRQNEGLVGAQGGCAEQDDAENLQYFQVNLPG